jgi:hypothetical protein
MAVVAGGGGVAGDRVPAGPATSRSLHFALVSSALALLFLWLSWLAAAARLVGGGVPSSAATGRSLFSFIFPCCQCAPSVLPQNARKWDQMEAKKQQNPFVSDKAIRAKEDLTDSYSCQYI